MLMPQTEDTFALFSGTDGLQEVCCEECGTSLGYQAAGTEVQQELWQHTRCPVQIARGLGISRDAYDRAFAVAAASINASYPDFGDPEHANLRTLRAELAAGTVLEALSVSGFT